jgi:hypothetical protein
VRAARANKKSTPHPALSPIEAEREGKEIKTTKKPMAKKAKLETKKTKRLLRVVLTRDELLAAGKSQADKLIELGALENDRKRIADDFKAKMSALEAESANLANQISSGYVFRQVSCTEHLGTPEPTQKEIFRDDTGERVGVEEMNASEMQRELMAGEEAVAQ